MNFDCGPIEPIYSFNIYLAELVQMNFEIKRHNFEIIANDFNRFTNLCFRKVCNPSASIVGSYGSIGFIMTLW